MKSVAILLSTFDGERFIAEQLDSILNQDFQNWTLYIRDDSSSDSTPIILRNYSKRDDRIVIIKNISSSNLGPCESYLRLLEHVYFNDVHDLFFFCDQDDVWEKTKISKMVSVYDGLPSHQKCLPLGIYSNFVLIDEHSNLIEIPDKSLTASIILPENACIEDYMFANNYYGFALAVNRTAAKLAIKRTNNLAMHDWWLVLIIISFGGRIIAIENQLTQYRQHNSNVIGQRFLRTTPNSMISLLKRKIKYWPLINNQISMISKIFVELRLPLPLMLLHYDHLKRTSRLSLARLASIVKMRRLFSFRAVDFLNIILLLSMDLDSNT